MNILLPFLILTSISFFLSINFRIALSRTYLIASILLTFVLFIFGKFGFLDSINEFLKYLSIGLFFYLLIKKKINSKHVQNFAILLLFYIILILVCKDLYYYKYDEFSEYGITTKLIFSENDIPSNIHYLQKGSHHKINFISYFHYFFLKNSTEIFIESITYIAHSIIIFSLLAAILSFIDVNYIKKIFIGLIFYFFLYALGPGIDRLYMDTIVSLFTSLILLIYFNKKIIKSDYFLLFLLVTALPMVKPNGILIIAGLFLIFILYSFYKKKFILIITILIALFSNHLMNKFYLWNISELEFNKDAKGLNYNLVSPVHIMGINQVNNINNKIFFSSKFSNLNFNTLYFKQIEELKQKGIYHTKTFLIFNKIFKNLKINFRLIEIPLNIFYWLSIMFLITYFISKKNNSNHLYFLVLLYSGLIISYYLFLIYWAGIHNLIKNDYSLAISWQRHLGTLILSMILFLLVKFFQLYKSFKVIIFLLLLSISITLPNSIRTFLPTELVNKDLFWMEKVNQRKYIKNISQEINNHLKEYSTLIFAIDNNNEPYFAPILKYELTKLNTIDIQSDNFLIYFHNFFNQGYENEELFLITNDLYSLDKFQKNFDSKILNLRVLVKAPIFKMKDNLKITFKLEKEISELKLYEIIIEKK